MTKTLLYKRPATFILGGLIGTGAALLFAPVSGRETRAKITGYAADVKGRAKCYALRAKDKVTKTAEKTGDYFSEKKSLFSASFDAGKKAYRDAKNRLSNVH